MEDNAEQLSKASPLIESHRLNLMLKERVVIALMQNNFRRHACQYVAMLGTIVQLILGIYNFGKQTYKF